MYHSYLEGNPMKQSEVTEINLKELADEYGRKAEFHRKRADMFLTLTIIWSFASGVITCLVFQGVLP